MCCSTHIRRVCIHAPHSTWLYTRANVRIQPWPWLWPWPVYLDPDPDLTTPRPTTRSLGSIHTPDHNLRAPPHGLRARGSVAAWSLGESCGVWVVCMWTGVVMVMVNGDGDDDGDLLTRTIRIRALWHIYGLSVYTHQYVYTSYELFVYTHRVIVASDALASLHNDYWSNHMPDISDMPTIRHSDMLLYQKTAKLKGRGRKIRWHIIYKHFVYVTYYTHTNMLYMLHITRNRLKPHSLMKGVCGSYLNHAYDYSLEKCMLPVRFRNKHDELVDLVRHPRTHISLALTLTLTLPPTCTCRCPYSLVILG